MIRLSKENYYMILEHARSCAPEEACGLIAGKELENGDKIIEKVYLIENADHSTDHFTITPRDQLMAIKDMRNNGLKALGNWHSHPCTPSRPSDEDKRLAYNPMASYMILSLQDNNPVLKSFHIEDSEAYTEDLVIE